MIAVVRKIEYIVVHCSATKENQHFTAADIKSWHTSPPRNWRDIGYHFVVLLDGTIERGRPISQAGAHVKGYNSKSIGICYIGGVDQDNEPKDTRTMEQKTAMRALITGLKHQYPKAHITGHRDFPGVAKACPSFNALTEYADI